MSLNRSRWILIGLIALFGCSALIFLILQTSSESDPHRTTREAYARQQQNSGFPSSAESKSSLPESTSPPASTALDSKSSLETLSALPGDPSQNKKEIVTAPVELETNPQAKKITEIERTPPPLFEEPPIPQPLLDQTPPSRKEFDKKALAITPGRYRFNNQSPDALGGNVVVTQDNSLKEFNLGTFAPELEDIDLALLDNINSSALELDVAAGVWTPFYFQGNRLLEIGDKLRGQASPGRQRNRLIVKFTKIIKKDGRSLPIQGISLAVDGTLGIPGEKVGNLFQAAAGPLLAELIKGVSETFQDRERAVVGDSTVLTQVPTQNLKNAGLRGSQRVLEKIEELMSEELEENKPYLFVRAGTRLRCRLQTAVDLSQVDYGK